MRHGTYRKVIRGILARHNAIFVKTFEFTAVKFSFFCRSGEARAVRQGTYRKKTMGTEPHPNVILDPETPIFFTKARLNRSGMSVTAIVVFSELS